MHLHARIDLGVLWKRFTQNDVHLAASFGEHRKAHALQGQAHRHGEAEHDHRRSHEATLVRSPKASSLLQGVVWAFTEPRWQMRGMT